MKTENLHQHTIMTSCCQYWQRITEHRH